MTENRKEPAKTGIEENLRFDITGPASACSSGILWWTSFKVRHSVRDCFDIGIRTNITENYMLVSNALYGKIS